MSELNFPQATDELMELILGGASPEQVDQFLTNWGLHCVHNFTSFLPVSYGNDEILDGINDSTNILTMYDEDEEN